MYICKKCGNDLSIEYVVTRKVIRHFDHIDGAEDIETNEQILPKYGKCTICGNKIRLSDVNGGNFANL